MESFTPLLGLVDTIKQKINDNEYKQLMEAMQKIYHEKPKYCKVLVIIPVLLVSWLDNQGESFITCEETGMFTHDVSFLTKEEGLLKFVEAKSMIRNEIKILKIEPFQQARPPIGVDYIEQSFYEAIKDSKHMNDEGTQVTTYVFLCDL